MRQQPTCSVEHCERPPHSRNLCGMHHQRYRRHGSVFAVEKVMPPREPTGPRTTTPAYITVHQRQRKAHGHPSNWLCIDCDSPAQEWSLSPMTPPELILTGVSNGRTLRYAADLSWMEPRCRSHHRKLDKALARDR